MKIRSILIEGLHGREFNTFLKFNDDVNILTGRNGSGKTTILKLLWYLVSANIERAVREIHFSKIDLLTDPYRMLIEREEKEGSVYFSYKIWDTNSELIIELTEPEGDFIQVETANSITNNLLDESIFFPTFRRIEGGFSMNLDPESRRSRVYTARDQYYETHQGYGGDIQSAIAKHADMLSFGKHRFVSSISTIDVKQIVTQRHNTATNRVESVSKSLSDRIINEIRDYNSDQSHSSSDAEETLDKIYSDVENFEKDRDSAFKALSVLSDVVDSIFIHKGIKLNSRITLGEVANSISSESLSAGEKQMLSFLCYNAFYNSCPFFIDEPELSLHVDWQRMLVDVMLEQSSNNQYFIATHSPFIYSQYEDKEIRIDYNRGDSLYDG